jgi:TetR/AcrR family transcriptional repressor of nem operon
MDSSLKDRLVAAARDVLMLDGFAAATPEAIARRTGVSTEDFAAVFPDSREAVLAAIEVHWKEVSGFMDSALATDVPPLERLRRFTEGAYAFQDHHWNRLGCVVGCMLLRVGSSTSREEAVVRERVAACLGEWQSRLEATIRDAQALNSVRPGDPGVMAWTLVQFIEGVLGMARIQNDVHTLQGMLDRSLEFLGAEPSVLRR